MVTGCKNLFEKAFDNHGECSRILDGDFGKGLAVDFDVFLQHGVDHAGVGGVVQACSGVDTHDSTLFLRAFEATALFALGIVVSS